MRYWVFSLVSRDRINSREHLDYMLRETIISRRVLLGNGACYQERQQKHQKSSPASKELVGPEYEH